MSLTREQKAKIVEELKEKFSRQKAAFFVSFAGVDVKTSQKLRKDLKVIGGEYKVAKKTLLRRAFEQLDLNLPLQAFQGQVGVVFDYTSPVNVAKTISQAIKTSSFTILCGLVEGRFLAQDQVKELASLPPLEVMYARLIFTLQSPLRATLNILQGIYLRPIFVLKAIASKIPNN